MLTTVVDRVLAALGLLVTSPFLLISAIGVKLSSPGPALYRAERAGQGGKPFLMLKLRTMHAGAATGGRITGSRDPRVFGWGAVLRRFKLDELPQLVNVLRGDMAIVGPRPEDVGIVREHYDPMMLESLEVAPGITSPGSLHYFADEATLPDDPHQAERVYLDRLLPAKIALDLVYVRNRSLRYQLEIIMRTALGIIGLGRLFRTRLAWERAEADRILAVRTAGGDPS